MVRICASLGLLLALCQARAPAQESLRLSLAGEQAAETRRKANSSIGYYNLKLGPTAWRFGYGLGIESSDNIRLEARNPEADVVFRPEISAQMNCPISAQNNIGLVLSGGYSAYVQHTEFNRWF